MGRSVTLLGKKSSSVNIFLLNGLMQLAMNPFIILVGMTALGKDSRARLGISYIVIDFPGWLRIQSSWAIVIYFFKGLYTDLSSSCKRWKQSVGNDNKITSLIFARSKNTGFSFDGWKWEIKCFMKP
jgi:hypothetical protein